MTTIVLHPLELAAAAVLILINAALSLRYALGLEVRLVVAAARMVVQLLAVGLVIKILFGLASPVWTGLMALVMVLAAGWEVRARQERRFSGPWSYGLGTLSMMTSAGPVTLLALAVILRPEPWYEPRYAIPLLGMVLGNTMTGVSLAIDTLVATLGRERAAIEARLSLGADRDTAFRPYLARAVRTGMIPIVNAMAAAGVVSLPGMMTGQILAGADPVEAVKYQILIIFLIAGGTGLGVLFAVAAASRRLSDSRHRLRLDRLDRPKPGK